MSDKSWRGESYDGGMADELREAKNRSSAMVVDMEKLQGFLLEEQKYSINEFNVFRQIIQLLISQVVQKLAFKGKV